MLKTALIIEDCETTAKWFKQSLSEAYQNMTVSVCYDCQTAHHYLSDMKVKIDIALVDINLPDGDGLDLIRPLLEFYPNIYIVVISVLDDSQHILTAIRRGAKGYLLKGLSKEICIEKMRAISDNEPPLSPIIAQKILQTIHNPVPLLSAPQRIKDDTNHLTAREIEVLRIIAKGYNRKETARLLSVSESTIATHIRNIYSKLHISNRSEATVAAYQMNLISMNNNDPIIMPINKPFEIPARFINVHYNGQRTPEVENQADLTLGANCQLYAYELLRHFGKQPPSLRSSELWSDCVYTQEVTEYEVLDLMLYNDTAEAYGAHVGVYVGDGKVLHLSYVIGHPVIQLHTELLSQEKYACFIGAKRVLT